VGWDLSPSFRRLAGARRQSPARQHSPRLALPREQDGGAGAGEGASTGEGGPATADTLQEQAGRAGSREGGSLGWGPYREAGVAGLDPELCQHPDAVGELQGLVEHVLAFHVPLGDGEDVTALELAADGICAGGESCGGAAGLSASPCPISSSPPSPRPTAHPKPRSFGWAPRSRVPLGGQATAPGSIRKPSRPASLHEGQLATASGGERTRLSLPGLPTSRWAPGRPGMEPGERGGTRALPVVTGMPPCPGEAAARLHSVRAARLRSAPLCQG